MTLNKYEEAVHKSVAWILTQQNADGSLNPADKAPAAFYKVPRALALAGHATAAQRFLDVVERDALTGDGDFGGKAGTFHEDHWTYANCWFVWASVVLSRLDLAYRGMAYLLSHRDPHTGGYCSRAPYDADRVDTIQEDMLSTAFTSFVGLHLGRLDEARDAADFLKRLLDMQPDVADRLYLRTNGRGELITTVPANDPEPRHYVIEAAKPQQFYYFIGAAISFLAKLYTVTGKRAHLELALEYLGFATRCHDDVYETDAAGKIGLGCAYLYGITGDRQYRTIAHRVADFLVADQQADGYWMRGGKPTASSSAEFCVWLGEFARMA